MLKFNKRTLLWIVGVFLVVALPAGIWGWKASQGSSGPKIVVYKSPTCGCCHAWEEYLEANGFSVESHPVDDITAVKTTHGIPAELGACHTAMIDGYLIEGHVPVPAIKKLLVEKPDVRGIAVPGMPMGSPGMEGDYTEKYDVISFGENGQREVFMRF